MHTCGDVHKPKAAHTEVLQFLERTDSLCNDEKNGVTKSSLSSKILAREQRRIRRYSKFHCKEALAAQCRTRELTTWARGVSSTRGTSRSYHQFPNSLHHPRVISTINICCTIPVSLLLRYTYYIEWFPT